MSKFIITQQRIQKLYICVYTLVYCLQEQEKSHQSLRDISLLSSIPNMRIYHPYNYIEVKQILKHCINLEKNNCAIRLSIGPPPLNPIILPKNYKFIPSEGSILIDGSDGIIFSYGQTMVNQAFKVCKILKKENINLKIN